MQVMVQLKVSAAKKTLKESMGQENWEKLGEFDRPDWSKQEL